MKDLNDNKILGRINKITYSTGIQINEYTIELVKANPILGLELLKKIKETGQQIKYFIIKNNKLIEVDKFTYENYNNVKIQINGENQRIFTF